MSLFWIFAFLTFFGLIAYGFQIWAVRSYLSTPCSCGEGLALPRLFPPVSVLKPLKGLDDNLYDNLLSFCSQDYPEYEIIFSLQSHNDPAYRIAKRIKDKHPGRNISIIVEDCSIGLNPKVNNLLPAYKASKYEYILISDSNVIVDKNYLREITKPIDNSGPVGEVGLVSNIIKGVGGRSLGAIFENLHLNSFIVGSVCFLHSFLKLPCVIGKSMLMSKKDLEAIGGLRSVKDILAEDYVIGERMHKAGKKVVLSNYMISNVNEYWGFKRFLNRHTRWGKLRWKIGGSKYVFELIGNPVFMSAMPIVFWQCSKLTVTFAVLTSIIKVFGDFYLGRKTGAELDNPFLYLLSPVKDLVIGLIWTVPIVSNTVVWRGNRYSIGKDSILSPCPETGIWSLRYRIIDAIKERFA
ncbi:MAG: glycosyltransferase [Nitrospirae bacterium]|nr:glycosyltransferase [Nitrospirota bacterium]